MKSIERAKSCLRACSKSGQRAASKNRCAYTLVELLMVITLIIVLCCLLLPIIASARGSNHALRDASQMKEIHNAFTVWANEHRDLMPTPSLKSHLPPLKGSDGQPIPQGPGSIYAKNHTRHLYSMMVMGGFFNTDLLVGPTEVNPHIRVYADYNYDAYDPNGNILWDGDSYDENWTFHSVVSILEADRMPTRGFRANHSGQGPPEASISHTSYAHMAICGLRRRLKWRNSQRANVPMLANRGPGGNYHMFEPQGGCKLLTPVQTWGGVTGGPEYRRSYTLQLHGSRDTWIGNVVFADNHVQTRNSFILEDGYQPNIEDCPSQPDNIFAAEFLDFGVIEGVRQGLGSNDAYLGIFRHSGQNWVLPWREALAE